MTSRIQEKSCIPKQYERSGDFVVNHAAMMKFVKWLRSPPLLCQLQGVAGETGIEEVKIL
jgi:hypothetical protein